MKRIYEKHPKYNLFKRVIKVVKRKKNVSGYLVTIRRCVPISGLLYDYKTEKRVDRQEYCTYITYVHRYAIQESSDIFVSVRPGWIFTAFAMYGGFIIRYITGCLVLCAFFLSLCDIIDVLVYFLIYHILDDSMFCSCIFFIIYLRSKKRQKNYE